MFRISAYYPNGPGATFNFDYYSTKHVELFRSRIGAAGIERIVVERGVAGLAPGSPAPFIAVFHATIRDGKKFAELMAKHGPDLMADLPNYTTIQPQIQVGETLVG